MTKARSKIILSVDPHAHIQDTSTAADARTKLKEAFEDSGLTRKVSLLRTLVTTQLEKYQSVEEYVNIIITTAHKLNGLDFKVLNEWVGILLFARLPDDYRPMIMGLESSGTPITADSIKTKLLQDVKISKNGESALFSKRKKTPKCLKCKKIGYYANKCKEKPKEEKPTQKGPEEKQASNKNKAYYAFISAGRPSDRNWYVDSCASTHVTAHDEWLENSKNCANSKIVTANS